MHLRFVTMTGADQSVTNLDDLFSTFHHFPFVEWGILVSFQHTNAPRFPSHAWITDLVMENQRRGRRVQRPHGLMPLSLHLCGRYVRDLLNGGTLVQDTFGDLLSGFQRIQLNFHGDPHRLAIEPFLDRIQAWQETELILQVDNVNTSLLHLLHTHGRAVSALFDTSGGAGIVPHEWPALLPFPCGYAGGLGPETLPIQLPRIAERVQDQTTWIDMERRIRSTDDESFLLDKVHTCLALAQPYTL